jgi:uncharacterized protein (TIGR03435 family)
VLFEVGLRRLCSIKWTNIVSSILERGLKVWKTSIQIVLLASLACGLLYAAEAQVNSVAAKLPTYDVASIKPSKPGDRSTLLFRPGGFSASGITLQSMIQRAYGIEEAQIIGAPAWVHTQRFDIEAKADGVDTATLDGLSEDQSKLMFQIFLTDRFGLKFHRETKSLSVLELVIAKGGPRLKTAKPGDTYPDGIQGPDGNPAGHAGLMRWGNGRLTGQGITVASLVPPLTQQLGRIVVDKTGLEGQYDVELRWTPDNTSSPIGGQSGPVPDSPAPSIFTAIQEQLGLKLESRKAPVDVLVVDHVEAAAAN